MLVRGKTRAQSVYEVFDADPPEIREAKKETVEDFERAIAYYHLREVDRARELLDECLARGPEDKVARIYRERCDSYLAHGTFEGTGELDLEVRWSNEYSVHDELMDAQHMELLRQINRLSQILRDGDSEDLEEILGFLGQYALDHFNLEMELLDRYDYPFIEQHGREHDRFVEQFMRLSNDILSGRHDRLLMLFRVNLFLVDWLINHTTGLDRHYAKHLRQARAEDLARCEECVPEEE